MSVHVEAWASRQTTGSPTRKLILLALADNANDDGWLRWPQAQLPRMCEVSKATFEKHVAGLVQQGFAAIDGTWCRLLVPWESGL